MCLFCFFVCFVLVLVVQRKRFCLRRVTFNKVHDQAREHQAWHRCQIITEFYSHTLLPAPLNILLCACRFVLSKIKRCCRHTCCRHTCCRGQRDRRQTAKQAGLELQNMGAAARGNTGRDNAGAGGNAGLDQRIPLIHRGGFIFLCTSITAQLFHAWPFNSCTVDYV